MNKSTKKSYPQNLKTGYLRSVYERASRLLNVPMSRIPDTNFACPYTMEHCAQEMCALLKYREQIERLSKTNSSVIFFEGNSAVETYAFCDCVNCKTFKAWVDALPRKHGMTDNILMANIELLKKARG